MTWSRYNHALFIAKSKLRLKRLSQDRVHVSEKWSFLQQKKSDWCFFFVASFHFMKNEWKASKRFVCCMSMVPRVRECVCAHESTCLRVHVIQLVRERKYEVKCVCVCVWNRKRERERAEVRFMKKFCLSVSVQLLCRSRTSSKRNKQFWDAPK